MEFISVMLDLLTTMPGGVLVVLGSLLLIAPPLGFYLFRRTGMSAPFRRNLLTAVGVVGTALAFGPALWQDTVGQGPYDNPGLFALPLGLVLYSIPAAVASVGLGASSGLLSWLALRVSHPEKAREAALGVASVVAIVSVVPLVSFALWLAVRMAQIG